MTRLRLHRPRLRLDPESYRQLREQVLKRDRWRCQHCGRTTELHIHHIRPRGRLGDDTEQNLITLCARCHQRFHLHKQSPAIREEPDYLGPLLLC